MFEDDLALFRNDIDPDAEIKQMETKASILETPEQRYLEFSKLVINSMKSMEQKLNELMYNKRQIRNKENQPTQLKTSASAKKSASVGKVSVKAKQPLPLKSRIAKPPAVTKHK